MMAMMLPDVGALKVTSGCKLVEHNADKRHDKGSGSKIKLVLLNNAAKIVQAEHKTKFFLFLLRRSLSSSVVSDSASRRQKQVFFVFVEAQPNFGIVKDSPPNVELRRGVLCQSCWRELLNGNHVDVAVGRGKSDFPGLS